MFTKQIRQLCYERQQAELWEQNRKKQNGEYIYVNFCVWCNAYNDGNGKNDAKLFAKFLKQENIELTFWQRKHLAEKYFGYKYEYDYAKGEWEIKKINNESENGD